MAATLTGELAALMSQLEDPDTAIVAHLGKNPIPSTVDVIDPTTLVECDFPGYAPVKLTDWEPIFLDDDNYGEADSGEVDWTAGAVVAAQVITCVFVTVQVGDSPERIWDVIVLPEPVAINLPGDLFWFSFRAQSANIDSLPVLGDDS